MEPPLLSVRNKDLHTGNAQVALWGLPASQDSLFNECLVGLDPPRGGPLRGLYGSCHWNLRRFVLGERPAPIQAAQATAPAKTLAPAKFFCSAMSLLVQATMPKPMYEAKAPVATTLKKKLAIGVNS